MKKVVFATGNQTKAKRFSKGLLKKDIEVLSLKDLNISLEVEENGKDAIENALIKARECFKLTNMPSMGMDDTLYLEGLPDELQPGLFVRRINGKTLNDDEMIEYYTNLVRNVFDPIYKDVEVNIFDYENLILEIREWNIFLTRMLITMTKTSMRTVMSCLRV